MLFRSNDTATTEIYTSVNTLSLHDALPILATSFYKDARVDEWVVAADRESNPDKRKAMYCDLSKKVWADAPWLFLYVQRFPIVYSAKVTDVGSLPNEKFSAIHARPAN